MQDRIDAYQDPNRDGHPPCGNQGLPAGKKIWLMQMLEGGTLDRSESCQGFKKNHDSDRHFCYGFHPAYMALFCNNGFHLAALQKYSHSAFGND